VKKDILGGTASTRRSFLKSGMMFAVPLAAVVAPTVVMADDELKLRVGRLENQAAIRELHQRWLRSINTGDGDANAEMLSAGPAAATFDSAVRSIATDHAGQPDALDIAAGGQRAVGRFHCIVESETPIAQDCTLARMAHAQGGGFVRRAERRVLKVEYVKASSAWKIAKAEFENEIS
jgi:hypothetical protein